MSEKSPVYLLMVTRNNNNKYYKMIPHGDIFEVEYGRVGATCQHASYSMSQWDKKYKEKIKKGYVDQTHLVQDLIQKEPVKSNDGYKKIENKVIAEIVQRLQDMARQKIQANYKVSSQQVTQAMVDEAQNVIDDLMNKETVEDFNNTLLTLFTVIPRKMGNVNDYLSKRKDDFAKILKDEQDLLDVMRGQVVTHTVQNEPEKVEENNEETIIEAMGLIFEEVDASEVEMIKGKLGEISNRFHKAWRVRNIRTQKRFDDFVKKEGIKTRKLLWHGSRNENWWSIINTGLVLRPTNAVITGKLYGMGTYFAPKARKSLGYTSVSGSYWAHGNDTSGFMALMDVAYGTPFDVYDFNSKYYNMNYENLQKFKEGANCLHAHAGASLGGYSSLKNDEIVVYKEEQCTIRYLVELK